MPCPNCAAAVTTRQPKTTALGYQTFRCATCRRTFNERTDTPFNFLEYPTDIVLLLVVLWRLRYKLSLRDLTEMFLKMAWSSPMRPCANGRSASRPCSRSTSAPTDGAGGPLLVRR